MTVTDDAATHVATDVTDLSPAALVDDYRPGSFLLASPERTILALGRRATVSDSDPDTLADRVAATLAEHDAPLAVGALPFDDGADAHIVVPDEIRTAGPLHPVAARLGRRMALSDFEVTPVPEPAEYERGVARAVVDLTAGALRKVVLARALRLTFASPIDVRQLLLNVGGANTLGYTFAADLPSTEGHRTIFGATPELLLQRNGTHVLSNPLAGSAPRMSDPVQDKASAEALFASAKDQDEHRVVVEAVVEALAPFCRGLSVPREPSLLSTPTMWHLSSRITGELFDRDVSALRLAAALHPTPAVCGSPRQAARDAIAELEPFDRGFYGGAVGWCDAAGDGQWTVAIRCAEVRDTALQLYAGAGIMPASDPASELAETSAKFRTLLQAMGLDLET